MKRFLNMLCVLCALAAIICLSATTVLAAETDTKITELNVLVDDLVPGQPLPTPTVPEGAPYTITSWTWYRRMPRTSISAEGGREKAVTCADGQRYELTVKTEPIDGYTVSNTYTNGLINGSITPNGTNQVIYTGTYTISHTWSLRTVLDRVELSYELPPVGASTAVFAFEYDTTKMRIGNLNLTEGSHDGVFIDHFVNTGEAEVFIGDGYEFSDDVVFVVNGEEMEKVRNHWDGCSFRFSLDYDQNVTKLEFPAWPETVQPGPGGVQELTVPEGAGYRLAKGWMDMRTGQTVETLVAGNVYTLAYVAMPENGFHFTEETVFTLGGEACEPMGDEQYMVIYKPYDLGATKIDRVEITTPKLTKGYAPGNVTVAADAPYEVMETLWAESVTGKFDDAEMVEGPSYNTSIYAIPVLSAKDGYAFADDVKLFINGQEVAVEYCDSMVNVIELAGYAGTLTPPATDGWHKEDNTWAYYRGGEKMKKAWIRDSVGWVYLDENGLMVQNGFAKDSHGTCYMGANGYMVKNRWVKHEGGWYYLDANGYLATNRWIRDSRDWCYVGADGKMYANAWVRDSVGWCYIGEDGYMVRNAWAADSQGICRLGADGYIVKNSWIDDGTGWAYVDDRGYAVQSGWRADSKGWRFIDGYYVVTNVWAKDTQGICRLGADGYMLKNQWVNDGTGWAYVDQNGYAVFDQFVKDSQGTCYIGSGGYMVKGQHIYKDGYHYYIGSDGYLQWQKPY